MEDKKLVLFENRRYCLVFDVGCVKIHHYTAEVYDSTGSSKLSSFCS